MKHFALRIKDNAIFDSLEVLSEQEDRSINNFINVLIKEALTARNK